MTKGASAVGSSLGCRVLGHISEMRNWRRICGRFWLYSLCGSRSGLTNSSGIWGFSRALL